MQGKPRSSYDDFDGYSNMPLTYRTITEQPYMQGNFPIDDCLLFSCYGRILYDNTAHTVIPVCIPN